MIISHRFNFIYIRTRKTASTSTELALSRFLGPEDVITPLCERDENLRKSLSIRGPQNYIVENGTKGFRQMNKPAIRLYNYIPAEELRNAVDESVWQTDYKFCIDRNPWDKVISLYYHRYKSPPRPSLLSFIESGECADAVNFGLYTVGDEPIVDFIGRYENLYTDMAKIFDILHLPWPPDLPWAKAQFREDRRPYSDVLSLDEAALISKTYAKEISFFGYIYDQRGISNKLGELCT